MNELPKSPSSDVLTALRAVIDLHPDRIEASVEPELHHLAEAVTITLRVERELLLRFMRRWY